MNPVRGTVVQSKAGHDKGRWYAIAKSDDAFVYVIDGKYRKHENPKKKNPKHLVYTETVLDEQDLTNRRLRLKLQEFSSKVQTLEEGKQLV
jgi:ribosomal protein L14E/L6E/L27E